jgi:hypothetical protein
MSSFNSRIKQKHDIEANWNKALNFVPLAGEIVIYDIDETHSVPRVKIGDGNAFLIDLPFTTDNVVNQLLEHTEDSYLHLVAGEREKWNDKVRCYIDSTDNGDLNLIFTNN